MSWADYFDERAAPRPQSDAAPRVEPPEDPLREYVDVAAPDETHTGSETAAAAVSQPIWGLIRRAGSATTSVLPTIRMPRFRSSAPASVSSADSATTPAAAYDEAQELGVVRSHTVLFRDLRRPVAEDYRNRVLRLEVRVEKFARLFTQSSNAQWLVSHKQIERSLVPWEKPGDSPHPVCSRCSVNLEGSSDWDNCRLCGRMTCSACLRQVPLNCLGKPRSMLAQSQSRSFVHRTVVCDGLCFDIAFPEAPPISESHAKKLSELSARLSRLLAELNYAAPGILHLLHDSVSSEDMSREQYEDLAAMRNRLLQHFLAIDDVSKQILALPYVSAADSALRKNIRRSVALTLQHYKFNLPDLPPPPRPKQKGGTSPAPPRRGH
eukprot:m.102522 g.102522  ORF g.102522 m.102522 type:complete len:380 (-) comp9016_c0_seq2:74-1213(-)